MAHAITTVPDGPPVPASPVLAPPLLGQAAARIPTGGKIRPGIMVLTRQAAAHPEAKAIYLQGLEEGRSFAQIERSLAEALPQLSAPLVPRNVPWFTVRAQDFANPEMAQQILDAHGEDRGQGRRLYRFPVVFPSDHWQTVMPHELATWATHEKRYWSQYGPDGQVRHCMRHAPVPVDDTGRRTIRIFGGRKAVPREENGGICDPEGCAEYQSGQCTLRGRFLFFMPGVRSISALELPTTSFYAMSRAVQRFQAVAQLRGGRISGFLGRERQTFYLSKVLKEVAHIDAQGRAVRRPQWIIELEAPIDVTALLREHEDAETAIQQADRAAQVLEGPADDCQAAEQGGTEEPTQPASRPTLDQVLAQAQVLGVDSECFMAYANQRWGRAWRIHPHGRGRAWDEIVRYRNDGAGYRDKIETVLREVP